MCMQNLYKYKGNDSQQSSCIWESNGFHLILGYVAFIASGLSIFEIYLEFYSNAIYANSNVCFWKTW